MFSQAAKQFIATHRKDDVKALALQYSTVKLDFDLSEALTQIAGRQAIEHKIPSWYSLDDMVYPIRLSLEQCSSEITAQYKFSLLQSSLQKTDSLVDLTGGFGVDASFLARNFNKAIYVERNSDLCKIAQSNFATLKLNHIEVVHAESVAFLKKMNPVDCIYIDPARRSESGKKVMLIDDCEPNIAEIQSLLFEKAHTILIKLSPMLDIHAALKKLKNVREIHVVSVENECKELLFLLQRKMPSDDLNAEPQIHCVNFRKKGDHPTLTFRFSDEKESSIPYVSKMQNYFYEPNTSLLKAGCYKFIAQKYRVQKLHPDTHLYTSDELIPDFPGRIFQVNEVSSLNKKELKSFLKDIPKANLTVRNFPLSVADLRKKHKLKEGGDIYIFATTLADGRHLLVKGSLITQTF